MNDLKSAFRSLMRQPGFTATALITPMEALRYE
jgi:hypothetical protein